MLLIFFQQRDDFAGHHGISALMKCTSVILQLAYGSVPDSLDEYMQMGATTARKCLENFCKVIMNLYGEEFLRKPTYNNIEKLYTYHNEKHGFPGMGDHGPDPFILLEATASNDSWIWHAFFGVSGMNNDVNVLRQSPLFNDLKSGRAPNVPFVANNVIPLKKSILNLAMFLRGLGSSIRMPFPLSLGLTSECTITDDAAISSGSSATTSSTSSTSLGSALFVPSMALLNKLMATCATLTQKVANLEQDKIAQALEIIKLKQRVGKLEKKRRPKHSGLKRLRKFGTSQRVESSNDSVIDDQDDASK
uniref:Protein ALP1-like isoform X1 n=1 Tax=Tanacetum cinerariifolium TaxID=118510 RepID=A0A699J3U6_TANCI|nr:protein ALP1-like isoform X1 [Tanacetum cinerariifolium]